MNYSLIFLFCFSIPHFETLLDFNYFYKNLLSKIVFKKYLVFFYFNKYLSKFFNYTRYLEIRNTFKEFKYMFHNFISFYSNFFG